MYDVASEYVKLCTSLYTNYGKTALGESQDMHPIHAILPFLLLKSMLTSISRSSDILRFGIPRKKGTLHEWVTFGIKFFRFMTTLAVCSLFAICIQEGIYALTHAVYQYLCEHDTTGYELFFEVDEDPQYCRLGPLKLSFINCSIVTLMLLRDASRSNLMVRIFYMVIKTFFEFSTKYVPPPPKGVLGTKKYLLERLQNFMTKNYLLERLQNFRTKDYLFERLQNFDGKKSFHDIRGYLSTTVRYGPKCVCGCLSTTVVGLRLAQEYVLKLCGVENWASVTPERSGAETASCGDARSEGREELDVTRRENARSIWTATRDNDSDIVNDSDNVNEEDKEINMSLHGFDILDALLVESKLKVTSR